MTIRRERDLERICLSALERPDAERAAFLLEACGTDEELRREAESLIARDRAAVLFLEVPPISGVLSASFAVALPTMAAGDCIGPYTIVSRLGSGGMGEVYRARDAALDREVAVKVLPSLFTSDPQRIERFAREARLLASLNHPNIATIHGIERTRGIHALVLELVEGETLADRLRSTSARSKRGGGLALADVVSIARQIADALEVAHEKGIVHRDLKPANVMIRRDGVVKLLDFGLAKGRMVDPHGTPSAVSPTTRGSTDAGAIAGTASYMSPEQARGEPVDRRADVWAFGCVLYEMLTGRKVFDGRTAFDVLTAILESEPDFDALAAETPDGIRRLLRRALAKDPRNRLRDVGDARLELLEALSASSSASGRGSSAPRSIPVREPVAVTPAHRLRRVLVGLGAAMSAVATGVALVWIAAPQTPAPSLIVSRFEVIPPEPVPLLEAGKASFAAWSNGTRTRIAYSTSQGVAVRSLDQLDVRVIETRFAVAPFFSRDGEWVGYIENGLRKAPVSGGPSVLLARLGEGGTATSGDGVVIVADVTGLFRLSTDGGTPERVPGPIFARHEQPAWPEVLPGDSAVLYTVIPLRPNSLAAAAVGPEARIEAVDLRSGARRVVLRAGGRPQYVRSGHLVFGSGQSIMAVPFDADRLEVLGDPVQIAESGASTFVVSRDGTLVYDSADSRTNRTLVWVDRKGREEDLGAPPRYYLHPRLSPNGLRVALDVGGQDRDIWLFDLKRKVLEPFAVGRQQDVIPRWSLDSKFLFFASTRDGPVFNIYKQSADRGGSAERVIVSPRVQHPSGLTPDGRLLITEYVRDKPDKGITDILALSVETRQLEPLIATGASEGGPAVSPRGDWIAYESDESGQLEVYVRPYPKTEGFLRQVSTNGGRQAWWSLDGNELYYRDYGGALIGMAVPLGRRFSPGPPVTIVPATTRYAGFGAAVSSRTYDVSRDGSRFLMIKVENADRRRSFIVVQNWSEELKGRVPIR